MNNYLETIGLLKIKKMNYGMVRITYKSDEFQWWNLPTFLSRVVTTCPNANMVRFLLSAVIIEVQS